MNMIKRVAKAILETLNASDYETLVARRAIEAMKEPSDEMLDCIVWCPNGAKAYKAMIEAALKD